MARYFLLVLILVSLRLGLVDGCPFYLKSPCLDSREGPFLDVVKRKGVSVGSLDGWYWREMKDLPLPWFDKLADVLASVEGLGVWPEGLSNAYIAMIPEATLLGQ